MQHIIAYSAPRQPPRRHEITPGVICVRSGRRGEGCFKTVDESAQRARIVHGVRSFDKRGGGQCYSDFFDSVMNTAIYALAVSWVFRHCFAWTCRRAILRD